jgi:hypothetical protein
MTHNPVSIADRLPADAFSARAMASRPQAWAPAGRPYVFLMPRVQNPNGDLTASFRIQTHPPRPRLKWRCVMLDLVFLGLGLAVIAAMGLYARALERV